MSRVIRHFIDLADVTGEALRHILDEAHRRKAARGGLPSGVVDADAPLAGHVLAMIFDKPSTRTRVSFDMAMRQLGGHALLLNQNDTQLGRGETVADTARVLSRYVDALMVRTGAHETVVELATYADIPVINGLTAFSHPCQIIADIMTFETHKGAIQGQKIAWLGDGNNIAVSWIQAAALLGFELHLAVADGYHPPREVIEWAKAHGVAGAHLTIDGDAQAAVTGAAAVNTDCWLSMSDDPSKAASRAKAFAPFQVTAELMAQSDDGIFMHCLPAYRGKEVTAEIIDGACSVVFEEAENRTHAQKAILHWCLQAE